MTRTFARNHTQRSIYVDGPLWEAIGELAQKDRRSISSFIVGLLERERDEKLGKRPRAKPREEVAGG